MAWIRKLLHIKTDRQILIEVSHEPAVINARTQLKRVDRILTELEALGERK